MTLLSQIKEVFIKCFDLSVFPLNGVRLVSQNSHQVSADENYVWFSLLVKILLSLITPVTREHPSREFRTDT